MKKFEKRYKNTKISVILDSYKPGHAYDGIDILDTPYFLIQEPSGKFLSPEFRNPQLCYLLIHTLCNIYLKKWLKA